MSDHPRQPRLQWFRGIGNTAAEAATQKDIFDCFRLFFPDRCVQTILDLTNHNISNDANRVAGALSRGELWKYFGIRLAMSIDPCGGPIEDFWKQPTEEHVQTIDSAVITVNVSQCQKIDSSASSAIYNIVRPLLVISGGEFADLLRHLMNV